MIKFFVVLFVLGLIYLVFFKKSREDKKTNSKDEIDTMIECASCKTLVSKNDAILSSGKYYCSKECL